jgi:hypothetical protein
MQVYRSLQIPSAALGFFEHVVLTADALMQHFTATCDFEPLDSRSFRFSGFCHAKTLLSKGATGLSPSKEVASKG